MKKVQVQVIVLISLCILIGMITGCSNEYGKYGDSNVVSNAGVPNIGNQDFAEGDIYNNNLTKYFSLSESEIYSSVAGGRDKNFEGYWEGLSKDFDNETPLGGNITGNCLGRIEKNILSYSHKNR